MEKILRGYYKDHIEPFRICADALIVRRDGRKDKTMTNTKKKWCVRVLCGVLGLLML